MWLVKNKQLTIIQLFHFTIIGCINTFLGISIIMLMKYININDFIASFTGYFLVLMDGAIGSITRRFEQTLKFNEMFGFLFRIGKLGLKPHEQLKANCMDLALYLQSGDEKDICAYDLIEELLICQNIIDKSVTPIDTY